MLPGAQPGPTAIGGHQRAISERTCSGAHHRDEKLNVNDKILPRDATICPPMRGPAAEQAGGAALGGGQAARQHIAAGPHRRPPAACQAARS